MKSEKKTVRKKFQEMRQDRKKMALFRLSIYITFFVVLIGIARMNVAKKPILESNLDKNDSIATILSHMNNYEYEMEVVYTKGDHTITEAYEGVKTLTQESGFQVETKERYQVLDNVWYRDNIPLETILPYGFLNPLWIASNIQTGEILKEVTYQDSRQTGTYLFRTMKGFTLQEEVMCTVHVKENIVTDVILSFDGALASIPALKVIIHYHEVNQLVNP